MATGLAPFVRTERRTAGPVATAGNDLNTIAATAPFDGSVSAVAYTPLTTITGAATNNRTISLVNKGAAGSGTTVVATLSFGSGTNATGAVARAVTLSSTAADLVVAAGDVLQWQSTHVGTGIADPGGLVSVSFTRTV
jgi:hypothetical protein